MEKPTQGLESVKEYYGKILKSNQDLKTSACCTAESIPVHLREILKEIHDEVKDKFYGCGSPIPSALEGKTVLDLGSGTGRDCFILSKLVGPNGRVLGVDMTDEQIAVAQKYIDYHTKKFGFSEPNVKFIKGYIENLEGAGIKNSSVDVVVSNCVINLSPNKERVFSEIFRVLKPGGELYFSDVFSGRRIPNELTQDPTLIGECLGGALYLEDFRRMLFRLGCQDYRLTSRSRISLQNAEIERKAGMIDFYSMTIRAFKLELEDRCEDYGQVVAYLGTIPEFPHAFNLDDHHIFEKGKSVPVCSNTAAMLSQTRYAPHFKIIGDESIHYGLFDCGPTDATSESKDSSFGSCC
ncbi:MAG: methyltransferase domain-containing protein [Bdellovibrionales bacterium]